MEKGDNFGFHGAIWLLSYEYKLADIPNTVLCHLMEARLSV
jgi:hypothetical protein